MVSFVIVACGFLMVANTMCFVGTLRYGLDNLQRMDLIKIKANVLQKFLIGRDGQVKGRWASTSKPESLKEAIMKELNAPAPNL